MYNGSVTSHWHGILLTPTTLYGYVPTDWICVTFLTLFILTTTVHVGEALLVKPRLLWLLPTTVMCGIGEILGWSARLWSSKNPISSNAYLMQVTTTIISPVFLSAALYAILGLVIELIGFQYSRLRPRLYLKLFVAADVISLFVQASGGGLASSTNISAANLGYLVMLAGIFFQIGCMVCYTYLAGEFIFRFQSQKPFTAVERKFKSGASIADSPENEHSFNPGTTLVGVAILPPRINFLLLGLAISTILVFIRSFYRTMGLLGGWEGHITRTQVFFNVFDATPIFLALFILNVCSPAFLLRAGRSINFMVNEVSVGVMQEI